MPQAPFVIVAQNVLQSLRPLNTARVRRWALALVLPFAGVVTAFGVAPDTVIDTIERVQVVEDVALSLDPSRPGAQQSQADQTAHTFWREERIQRGDTLARVLARLRVTDDAAMTYLGTAPAARTVFQLIPGRSLRAATTVDGRLLTLHYLNGERLLTIRRDGESFAAEERTAQFETRVISIAGEIRSSLFAATDALNIPDAVAMQLVEIFSTDIDFHKDLRKNDRFSVVYEALYDGGEAVRAGRVLSAEFVNQGRTLNAVWFESKAGEGTYYTLEGKNIRKAFLRSPLEFSRISSGFSTARYHPILQSWRAHNGVDYVAPLGARIKATADGVVDFAGVQGGYGNVVILRHQNKYTTLYAHMSGFASGIHRGARVQQGDVIGAVGMTGLTTGPHVHYEFRINDVHHDPLSVAMPKAFPIAPEYRAQFQLAAAPLAHTMTLLRDAAPYTFE
jgi:murein DD-endopeptidase MepM/ murein hydrolase activator NlpD